VFSVLQKELNFSVKKFEKSSERIALTHALCVLQIEELNSKLKRVQSDWPRHMHFTGAFLPGEFEERLKSVLKELTEPSKRWVTIVGIEFTIAVVCHH
jgi:hypothetical protein